MRPDPFGQVLEDDFRTAIDEGMKNGIPSILPVCPLLKPLADICQRQHMVGKGLGYDVYRINDDWVLKVSSSRHRDVIDHSFGARQLESYQFLRDQLGTQFVPLTYFFCCQMQDRCVSFEVQQAIWGKPLYQLTNQDFSRSQRLRDSMRSLVDRILIVARQTGRMPDLWDDRRKSVIPRKFLFKSARYTSNIQIDHNEQSYVIDIGAWPEGFDCHRSWVGRLRVWKMTHDLVAFRARELS